MNPMVPLKVCALFKAALLSEKTFSHVLTLKLGIAGCQASPIGCTTILNYDVDEG